MVKLMRLGLLSTALTVLNGYALAITEVHLGDARFTEAEIDQQMTLYVETVGQHNSIYQTATTRWQSFIPTRGSLIGVAFATTASDNGDEFELGDVRNVEFTLYSGEGINTLNILAQKTVGGVYQMPLSDIVSWVYCRFATPIDVTPGQTYSFSMNQVNPNYTAGTPRLQIAVRTDNQYPFGRLDYSANWDYCFKVATKDAVAGDLKGTVTLADWTGPVEGRTVTLELMQAGNVVRTDSVTLDAAGAFASPVGSLSPGTYDVALKSSHWLRKIVMGVHVAPSGASGIDATLVNGDIDNDNVITVFDYNSLSDAFDTAEGDPNWNAEADLDGDGAVTVFDYNVLSTNFDLSGD